VTERGLREYADAVRARYREASKAEKGRILDEYCRTTAVHRKAAIRRLRAAGGGGGGRGGRPRQYGRELVAALERLWEVSGRLCGKLWVAWLTTRRCPPWSSMAPSPCAPGTPTTAGSFSTAPWSTGAAATGSPSRASAATARTTRPGSSKRTASSSGAWSAMTAWPPAAYETLQQLYPRLRQQLNFFRPVRKLLSKHRVGAKVVKRYDDAAQTLYQRLLATGTLTAAACARLEQEFLALNPAALAAEIQRRLERLWTLADHARRPALSVTP
jgi:hypothetical protein